MKKIALVILLIVVGSYAFAKQHKSKKKSTKGNEILSVTMHRTACFGRCPEYKIEIDNNGAAIYTGMLFSPDSGMYKKNIGSKKAMEVINQFKTYRVDTCQDQYENRIPDLPGIIYTIKYKGSIKTIHNAHFGPQFLKTLAEAMDAAGKKSDNTWKKVEDKK